MQEKFVELIPRLSEEKLVEELLVTNDEINTTFTRFRRSATELYFFTRLALEPHTQ